MSRTNIKFEIHQFGEPVPSRLKVVEVLSSKLKKDKELIIIRKISPDFGSSNVTGEALVYSSKKSLEKLEPKYTIQRIKSKEEAAKKATESNKPEEPKAEAPVEEKSAEPSESAEKPKAEEEKKEEAPKEEPVNKSE